MAVQDIVGGGKDKGYINGVDYCYHLVVISLVLDLFFMRI